MTSSWIASTSVAFMMLASAAFAETRLVMFEEDNCSWCEKWRAEIGEIYPKTIEGKTAPLRVLNIHDAVPEDIQLKMRTQYSPTFVLTDDGREVGRIEGYPGEDFFWGLLEKMIEKLEKKGTSS